MQQPRFRINIELGTVACPGCGVEVHKRSANHVYCGFRCRYRHQYKPRYRDGLRPPGERMLAVIEATQRGMTVRAIAREQGVSHQRVSQLVKRARRRGWLARTVVSSEP
jgi:DNA-binding NarL/FixJ family response regulator